MPRQKNRADYAELEWAQRVVCLAPRTGSQGPIGQTAKETLRSKRIYRIAFNNGLQMAGTEGPMSARQHALPSPMPTPAVPPIEQVSKAVVTKPSNLPWPRQSNGSGQPGIARCSSPDFDGAIDADIKSAFAINRVEPATHVLDASAETAQRVWFLPNVAELDAIGAGHADQATALPVDPGITHRAFGIVPNGQLWHGLQHPKTWTLSSRGP